MNSIAHEGNTYSIVYGDAYMGMFMYRVLLYGENFWETLLISVRFFFQGQDYSHRYFDGVLNPLLIRNMETRDEYLNRYMKSYGAICYINRHTLKNAGIRLLFSILLVAPLCLYARSCIFSFRTIIIPWKQRTDYSSKRAGQRK
jgi:hypothetical protein